MKRRLLVIAMMLMLAMFVTACGKQEAKDDTTPAKPPVTRKVTEDPSRSYVAQHQARSRETLLLT